MNVNLNTNYSVASRANAKPAVKQFQYFLENGDKLVCKHNKNLRNVVISRQTPKGEMFVAGYGEYNPNGISMKERIHFMNKMTNALKDGKRFMKEFFKSQDALN